MILELQRRLREIGRIRIGDQRPASNGRTRPAKLDTFRLTSPDRRVLEHAAALWGGEPRAWQAPAGQQFELYTQVDSLPVVIPPAEMAFSQWYEQWTAGGCRVRCDGQWDRVGERACHCDPEDRTCKIHTRLSVLLPDIPGLGVWRIETHGYYAAVELSGAVEVCQRFAAEGQLLPARLRLEQREVKRFGNDGKPVTMRFGVPVLDVEVTVAELIRGAPAAHAALDTPAPSDRAVGFQPVPELPTPSLADQLDSIDRAGPAVSRGRAPLPATGIDPRPAAEAASAPVEPLPPADPLDDWDRQKRRFHALAGKVWPGDAKEREAKRKVWLAEQFGIESLKDLTARQVAAAADRLEATLDDTGGDPTTTDRWADTFGSEHTWDRSTWLEFLDDRGVAPGDLKVEAQRLAIKMGEPAPAKIEDLAGRESLCQLLRAWVEDRAAGDG